MDTDILPLFHILKLLAKHQSCAINVARLPTKSFLSVSRSMAPDGAVELRTTDEGKEKMSLFVFLQNVDLKGSLGGKKDSSTFLTDG